MPYLDWSVYNQNRQFRMCFTKKGDKPDSTENYLRVVYDASDIYIENKNHNYENDM